MSPKASADLPARGGLSSRKGSIWPLVLVLAVCGQGCFASNKVDPSPEGPSTENASPEDGDNSILGAKSADPSAHALLVGCTTYDHLPKERQLRGPVNDVRLLRQVLIERFRFGGNQIVSLAEGGPEGMRPIRQNIEREFKRLANTLKPNERLVILLSGHGSRQPNNPTDKEDLEPDGMDEVFCPADVECLAGDGQIGNAIVDDELKVWLQAILRTGASVWLIADSCHSGTVSRNDEVRRGFDAVELSPESVESSTRPAARIARGKEDEPLALEVPSANAGALVALYAAQPNQETYETTFEKTRYGLLTYSLCSVLLQCDEPITYRELQQRIYACYRERNGYPPTPLLEGQRWKGSDTRDLEVLGTKVFAGRPSLSLRPAANAQYKLNAGSLHNITPGSVLAVHAAGKPSEQLPLGHVRVVQVTPLDAIVEPCEFGDRPRQTDLPAENRCEVVFFDYGLERLKLGVDPLSENIAKDEPRQAVLLSMSPLTPARLETLRRRMRLLEKIPSSVTPVDNAREADWLLRLRQGQLYLVHQSAEAGRPGSNGPVFGPIPEENDGRFVEWLVTRLMRISRATNLLRLASSPLSQAGPTMKNVQVDMEMLRYADKSDPQPTPIRWQRDGIKIRSGEMIGCRIENRSQSAVDVCLLFVDSGFGISQFFPEPGAADNRLQPKEKLVTNMGEVTADTIGLENLILVAVTVKPLQAPLDLSFLGQPDCLHDQRSPGELQVPVRRGTSPLERFLIESRSNIDAERGVRGVGGDSHVMRLFTWETLPQ